MGLESFRVAPDNKGGRPEKEEEEEQYVRRLEDAHTMDDDTEEYWQDLFDRHVSGDEPTPSEVMGMCNETVLLDRTVKQKLTRFGVYEYDEFKGTLPTAGKQDGTGGKSSEPSSGLLAAVENAK